MAEKDKVLDTSLMGPPQTAESASPGGVSTKSLKSVRKVRVLVENLGMGNHLYERGVVTSDPEVVGLVNDTRNLVEVVE